MKDKFMKQPEEKVSIGQLKKCDECGEKITMFISVCNTNIAFLVATESELYRNDDLIVGFCTNYHCADFRVLKFLGEVYAR